MASLQRQHLPRHRRLRPSSSSLMLKSMLVDWRSNIFNWQRRRWRPTSPTTSPWIMGLRLPQTPPPVDFESWGWWISDGEWWIERDEIGGDDDDLGLVMNDDGG
ncbi:hypothetical protein LWI28_018649 [Acer negundo]|uniref:Uncharacterized protein n=1 Tax=Acer negundo TaxID=4023 RepID=A0AAD5NG07_ACENE|nr:hypothetical protein LWI28_018649 [Acer negundo]KAK4835539.1 hypothetical protein QYF36_011153 [Acer negundo]